MTDAERHSLRSAILARYKSVYAFCKAHRGKIGKSVVVLLLAGKYPGNVERQSARLKALIHGFDPAPAGLPEPEAIMETLQAVACGHCTRKRKRKYCRVCQAIWREQTAALICLGSKGGAA